MFEIKAVLERVGRGESRSEVERATGHARKTIGRYVKRAEKLGLLNRPGSGGDSSLPREERMGYAIQV